MSDAAEVDSLSQRLAVGRLSSPGLLDRRALQRAHDRWAPSARAHLLDRLQRRVTPATSGAESLPLVRMERSADVEPAPSAPVRVAAPGDVAAGQSTSPAAATGGAASAGGNRITRSSPTISRTPAIVARRIAEAPGLVGSASAMSRIFKRSEHSVASTAGRLLVANTGAASPVIQRVAESIVAGRAANAESANGNVPETSTAAASAPGRVTTTPAAWVSARATPAVSPSLLMRKADAPAQSSVASANADSISSPAGPSRPDNSPPTTAVGSLPAVIRHATPAAADTHPLTRATSREPAGGSSRLVWRKPDPETRAPAAPALPAIVAAPSMSPAPPRLVLRKAVAAATSAGHPSQPPSIATAPGSVIARTSDTPGAGSQYGETGHGHDWNIEWIAEQVGKRLARRLEIERERTGARQWRLAN